MKKKSLAKRLVSFITAVGLSLTSTVMLIPASAAVDEAHADCPGAGTVVWTETDTNHQLACNGDGCDYTEGESHTADYQWTVVNGTQHQLVCKGTGCTLVSGDAHDENTQIGICPLCEEQTETYTVTVDSPEGVIIKATPAEAEEDGTVAEGTKVTIDYEFTEFDVYACNSEYTVTDEEGNEVQLDVESTSGIKTVYSFIMPASDVTVTLKVYEAVINDWADNGDGTYTLTLERLYDGDRINKLKIELEDGKTYEDIVSVTVNYALGTDNYYAYGALGSNDSTGTWESVNWNNASSSVVKLQPENGFGAGDILFQVSGTGGDITVTSIVIEYKDSGDEATEAYTVAVEETTNGTVEVDGDITTANVGDTVTFTVTPETDYKISTVKVMNGETEVDFAPDADIAGRYSFTMPAGNVTITATFKTIDYKILTDKNAEYTFEVDGEEVTTANEGDLVTVTPVTESGKYAKKVIISYEESGTFVSEEIANNNNGTFTFTMPASDVTVVTELADIVFTVRAGSATYYASDWTEAVGNIVSTATDYAVFYSKDVTVENLIIPSTANRIDFVGSGAALTIGNSQLYIPVDVAFNNTVIKTTGGLVDINVAADKTLSFTSSIKDQFIDEITGTSTSSLNATDLTVNTISGFGSVSANSSNGITIKTSASDIAEFSGSLFLRQGAEAEITNINVGGRIRLETGETLPKLTATDIIDKSGTGAKVTVCPVDENGSTSSFTDGQVIMYAPEDFCAYLSVADSLFPFYYSKTQEIKVQAAKLYLSKNGSSAGGYPSLEKAFEAITDSTADYTLTISSDVVFPEELVVPDTANSLYFAGNGSITYEAETLNIPVDTKIYCNIKADNSKGLIDIEVAENVTLEFTRPFEGQFIDEITGTSTSSLKGNGLIVNKISTFGSVSVDYSEGLTVKTSASDIAELSGSLFLRQGAEAEITNITAGTRIYLETGETLPKLTVTAITDKDNTGDKVTVFPVDENGNSSKFTDGQVIMYAPEDLCAYLTIYGSLYPFYYSKTQEIKVQSPKVYLYKNDESANGYPNLEKAFEAITDSTADYQLTINSDVVFPEGLVVPDTAKSLNFTGESSITFEAETLNIPVDTEIYCDIKADNSKGLINIEVAENVTLEFTRSVFENQFIDKITGTSTSSLKAIDLTVNTISEFGSVYLIGSKGITVNTSASGITELYGGIFLRQGAEAKITNITAGSRIYLETGDTLPKLTVTAVTDKDNTGYHVLVYPVDENGSTSSFTDGQVIMYAPEDLCAYLGVNDSLYPFYYPKTKEIKVEKRRVAIGKNNDDEVSYYPSIEMAFENINDPSIDYSITIMEDITLGTKFTLPKTAKSLTFSGETLTFTGTALAVPVDTAFNGKLAVSNSRNNLIDITVAAGKTLRLMYVPGEDEEPVQFINKLTGTKTSKFICGSVTVNNIAAFEAVSGQVEVNGGKATGIAKLDGQLLIRGTEAAAAVTDVVRGSLICLFEENGVLPKVTIDNVVGSGNDTSTPTISVLVNDENGFAELASGTTVLYSKNDIAENISIYNTTENNKQLTAYYYPKTKEIKAEDGTALTLYKGTEANEDTYVYNYPNFERLFAEITDSTADYIIEVNAPLTLDAKFALPKTAKSLTFTEGTAEDADGSLTFTGTKLIIPVNTKFDVKLSASNKTNLIDVSVAKDVDLIVTVNAYVLENDTDFVQFINKLSGTKTSTFNGVARVNNIASFAEVNTEEVDGEYGMVLLRNGKATGIAKLGSTFIIEGAKASADITEVSRYTQFIISENADATIPKVTVGGVSEEGSISVVIRRDGKLAELSSGTTVLYSKNDIAENVKITNTTSDGKPLTAYYYAKTKEIKAENGSALVLYKGVEKDKELVGSYKNFDELFAEITDSTVDYTIEVNTDITLGTNFAFPKKAKSIVLKGVLAEQEYPALIHTSTKLVIPYDVAFRSLDNVVSNKNNLIDISVAKGATFGCGERSLFTGINGEEVAVNKITGTKTSHISGDVFANNISTFDTVEGMIAVHGKATGINKFGGSLMVTPEATVDITEIANGSIIGLLSKNGVIPKVTLGEIGEPIEEGAETVSVRIFDSETNELVEIASGTPVLYSKKAKPDFTDKITIGNNGGEMKAYAYDKTIKAEYPDAVKVQIKNSETGEFIDFGNVNYPNFEAAVAAIDAEKNSEVEYRITLNNDVTSEKFALPKYAKSVEITNNAETGKLCTINVGKATSITANTDLSISCVAFVTAGKSLTLNAKKNLNTQLIMGGITAIKGSAKYELVYGESVITPDITGFGTVTLKQGHLVTGKIFNVNKLVLDGGTFFVSYTTTKASVKAIEVLNSGAIEYEEGAKTALTFTGKDADFIGELEIRGAVANGQTVLISDKVDVTKLSDGITDPDSEIEYEFKRFGKEIRYMGKVLEVSFGEEYLTELGAYATWGEVVEAIEAENNSEAIYTITLLDDYNANSAIKFPKAGTYKSIEIESIVDGMNVVTFDFNFTGNLTLTGVTAFNNVNLGAVKNGEPAKYTITGKNDVTIICCDTGLLTSITGKNVILATNTGEVTNADKVKATETLVLWDGTVKAIGGITAKDVCIYGNTNLVMNQDSKLAVTGDVIDFDQECKLTVTILDKKTGEPASLTEGYVIGSVKGEYAPDSIVLNAEAHPNLKIENVNGKLIVKKA